MIFSIKHRVFDRLKFEKLTPEEKEQYYSDLKNYSTAINCLETAEKRGEKKGIEKGIEIGMEKGIEKGREEERRKFSNVLRGLGLSLEDIAGKMGISREEAQLYLKG